MTWMSRDDQTDPEILYWIPKYILTRGNRPLSELGFMSPQFKALAASQDTIGWREFTEGHISTHFYAIQSFHLSMSSSYLNGEDWTKQFISRLLQITHAQWIFRNISLHDKTQGYLRNKKADDLLQPSSFSSFASVQILFCIAFPLLSLLPSVQQTEIHFGQKVAKEAKKYKSRLGRRQRRKRRFEILPFLCQKCQFQVQDRYTPCKFVLL